MPTILNKEVGAIGYGLMGLTWRATPIAHPEAFAALKAAINNGATFWNAGEFYGTAENNSLTLLKAYFTKYPEDASKIVLSIKGSAKPNLHPDGTPEGIRRSVENCLRLLDGTKSIDIFECSRIDPSVPFETTIGALAELLKEGKIGGIGLSEAGPEFIRRAVKVHPIAAVEAEVSLIEFSAINGGVLSTCRELGIPVVAYSPMGRGLVTGSLQKKEDIPEGDPRHWFPRFQEGAIQKNNDFATKLEEIAKEKGVTKAQLALGWVLGLNGREGMPVVIPIPGASSEARVQENTKGVELSKDEWETLDRLAKENVVEGDRYPEAAKAILHY